MYEFKRDEWLTLEEACEYLRGFNGIEIKQEQFVKRPGYTFVIEPDCGAHLKTTQKNGVTYFDKTHLKYAADLLNLYSQKNETGSYSEPNKEHRL